MTRIKLEPRPAYDFVVPIAVRTTIAPFAASRAGFRLSYRATREADRTLIALAESGLACFDYRARQVVPLPDRIREICQES